MLKTMQLNSYFACFLHLFVLVYEYIKKTKKRRNKWAQKGRVKILHIVILRSFKARSVMLHAQAIEKS